MNLANLAMPNALSLAAALVLSGAVSAQGGASALLALADRSDAIVQAHTNGVPSGSAATHVVRFRVERVLKGSADPVLQLSEPAGHSCGRALFGLAPGSYLLFLQRAAGEWQLAVSGSRSVVPAEPALVEHVLALASAGPKDRLRLLVDALDSAHPRLRADAVLCLPYLPDLESAGDVERATISAALRRDLAGEGQDLGLLMAAERLRLEEVLEALVETYLAGRQPHLGAALVRAIPRIDGDAAARLVAASIPGTPLGRVRAALLLRELPPALARPALVEIVTGARDAAAVRAAEALLHHGADLGWLQEVTAPSVLDALRSEAALDRRARARLRRPPGR